MKPGIYKINNETYHSSEGVSKSGLDHMLKSPAHYKWAIENRSAPTPQMVMGSAVHTLTLEPHLFNDEFVISDSVPDAEVIALLKGDQPYAVYEGKVRRGKAWDAFAAENADKPIILQSQHDIAASWINDADGKAVISESDYLKASVIKNRVMANPVARKIIEHPDAEFEQSIYWTDPETGLLCKCRPDIVLHEKIYDLKTTSDCAASSFGFAIRKYGYHRQAAFYLDGAKTQLPVNQFGFIAVDKTEPMMCTVFHSLDSENIEIGRDQIRSALGDLAACEFSGEWPGYPDEYDEINFSGHAVDFDWGMAA